jgi:hypothetical protein
MTKLLSALLAGTFAVATLTPLAYAQSDSIADACKGKKAGEEVVVGGKTVKCPEAKK